MAKFEAYWKDYGMVLSFAAVFDPRCQLALVRYSFAQLGEAYKDKWVDAYDKLTQLFNEHVKDGSGSVTPIGNNVAQATHRQLVDDFNKNASKSQLDLYLEENRYDHMLEMDVLLCWKENQYRYPDLLLMVRDILSIPITTVASESSFSMGGRILSKYGSSLLPDNAQNLITPNWLHGYEVDRDLEDNMELLGKKMKFDTIVTSHGAGTLD